MKIGIQFELLRNLLFEQKQLLLWTLILEFYEVMLSLSSSHSVWFIPKFSLLFVEYFQCLETDLNSTIDFDISSFVTPIEFEFEFFANSLLCELKIIHLYKANVLLAPHPCGENCFCVIRDFSDCIDFS